MTDDADELVRRLRAAGCVWAEDEAALLRSAEGPLEELVARRVAGEPLEYLLGWAEFRGIRVRVRPGVFVPRARSGLLVDLALAAEPSVVVDLCCGSGAIGAALLAGRPGLEVWAADADPAAAACAALNLPHVVCGDLFDPLPAGLRGRVDVVVANAPYVPTAELAFLPAEARDHEHRVALDGGDDGLALHRRLVPAARDWLHPGGRVVVECSRLQAPVLAGIMEHCGLVTETVVDEDVDGTAVLGLSPAR